MKKKKLETYLVNEISECLACVDGDINIAADSKAELRRAQILLEVLAEMNRVEHIPAGSMELPFS